MKKFECEIYFKLGINNLILFSIYSLEERKQKCDFESLAKECFELFPRSFCFKSIKKWPDSRKLDRPLRELRIKKLIAGSPESLFSLTKLGRESIEGIVKNLGQRKLGL